MRELILHCSGGITDDLSDALLAAGCLSVSVEDLDSDIDTEQPLFGEPGMTPETCAWARNRVTALLADGCDPAQVVTQVDWSGDWTVQNVPDADWVRVTQAQFGPIPVAGKTRSLQIIPSWHADTAAAPADAVHIQLDPGLAFGTGSHPTTHLCLQWLLDELPPSATLLDYGCGSGILAIGAAKFGASSVDAVDIDSAAVTATQGNAQANQVTLHTGLPELAQGHYDTVLANILATPLKVLAPLLCAHVATGGNLVLAGILERQAEELQNAYAPWLALQVADNEDCWILMTAQRN